jgi:hypothetical protein
MLTADAADSMAVELLIAVNPDEDPRLPYLLRVPLASGDLVFRTPGTWPRTKALYCYPVPLDEWPADAVIVDQVGLRSCRRRGAAIDGVFWQSPRTRKQTPRCVQPAGTTRRR